MNIKTIDTLLEKIKITPTQAVWVMGLSEKHAIWIANQIKANPQIFPQGAGDIKNILEWKKYNQEFDLTKHTFSQVLERIKEDEKSGFKITDQSLKNRNIVAVCDSIIGDLHSDLLNYKWVELKTIDDCLEEGHAMRNCLRDRAKQYLKKGSRLFSLRNLNNTPEVTVQIVNGELIQYYASENTSPNEMYADCIEFLEKQAKVKISTLSKVDFGIPVKMVLKGNKHIGDLVINDKCPNLPKNLEVTGNLLISDCEFVQLPLGLKVGKKLELSNIGSVNFSKNSTIGKDLEIRSCTEVYFEPNLNIGGWLDLSDLECNPILSITTIKRGIIGASNLEELDLKKVKIGGKIMF
jgi:hypothetical protein